MEVRFAANGGGNPAELLLFQQMTNTLRRLIECLGLHRGRIARDITPNLQDYIASKYRQQDAETEDADE